LLDLFFPGSDLPHAVREGGRKGVGREGGRRGGVDELQERRTRRKEGGREAKEGTYRAW